MTNHELSASLLDSTAKLRKQLQEKKQLETFTKVPLGRRAKNNREWPSPHQR